MKKRVASGILSAFLALSVQGAETTKIGIGVGLADTDNYVLRLPIDLSKELRIEPEFGLLYGKSDDLERTKLTVGSGFFLMNRPSGKINLYYGGRVRIAYEKTKPKNQKSQSDTTFYLGGTVGFEYLFDRHFSAGGEANAFLGFGDTTGIGTNGLALLRYYF